MMTLYTAIGRCKLTEKGLPLVIAGGRECALNTHELLLWSSLAFRILTYDELKMEFYEKEKELRILGELDFDHYLNRLIMRRLVASGMDCTGVDALYDLMGHLYLQSISVGKMAKIMTFLKLFLFKGYSLRKATMAFYTQKLEPMEKQIFGMIKTKTLSTAELILCTEKGHSSYNSINASPCEAIITESRFSENRPSVLTTVTNLYFKQHIIFEIL